MEENNNDIEPSNGPFAKLFIEPFATDHDGGGGSGGNSFREDGSVTVQLFTEVGMSSTELYRLSTEIRNSLITTTIQGTLPAHEGAINFDRFTTRKVGFVDRAPDEYSSGDIEQWFRLDITLAYHKIFSDGIS